MSSAISMIFIDVTVLPVALPTIQRSLDFSELGLQWIINVYTLVLAVFVLAGGRLGDRIGHRKNFCLALFLFSLGSILCGLSMHQAWFISSRVIQGIGGALLMPSSATILFSAFPPTQRGKAMGLYVSIGSVFLALGPFIGGVCAEHLSWRFIFWINIPIAFVGYWLTILVVPKVPGEKKSFDLTGFITATIGISALTVAIMESNHWGWTSPITLCLFFGGVFLIFLLWKLDIQKRDPYIPFSLFKNRNFTGSILAMFCTQFFLMVTVFWARFFQDVYGLSPTGAGTLSLVSNIPIILAAPIGGHLLDKHGPRIPITIGFLLVAGSLFWFLQILDTMSIPLVLSAIVPFGCGIPLILTPSFTTAIGEVATEKRGIASGTSTMIRQLGATLGLAVIGSLYVFVQMGNFSRDLKKNVDTMNMTPEEFNGLLSKVPEALEKLDTLPEGSQAFVQQSALHSYIEAFMAINILSMLTAILGLALALVLIKRKKRPEIEM